ncbi:stalk domain-containing protein [Paenibacillus albus]|uniref:Copper amine oxidase-like N-terminal domain-containing protein n=1 Tax=Paenibacillus albus TaxID=2495582 RepID=A0A3S9A9H7_9BACL|nr:hypothetical protein [Paenibacillus albus]AZN42447.1 hypothetical protein EJC50_24255 [Paenibacillus albus]
MRLIHRLGIGSAILALLSTTAAVEHDAAAAPAVKAKQVIAFPGKQVMPIIMKGNYVLFPGQQAPYLKSGKLMVPAWGFAMAIGSIPAYRTVNKSVIIYSHGESVGNIRAGQKWAVFEGDLGFGIEPAPELVGGRMFVPATPILSGLKYYQWSVMLNQLNQKKLIINDKTFFSPLDGSDPAVTEPFPVETTVHPDPLYPLALGQNAQTEGTDTYQLELQNLSGQVIQAGQTELQLSAVNHDRKWTRLSVSPITKKLAKSEKLTLSIKLPQNTEYVTFRARITK